MDRVQIDKRATFGHRSANAAMWMFYAGGSVLSFSQLGPLGSAIFLTAFSVGRIWSPPSISPEGSRGPALVGAGCIALLSLEPGLAVVVVLAGVVGATSRLSGLADPWITIPSRSPSEGGRGWSASLGATGAALLISGRAGDPTVVLGLAAFLFSFASFAALGAPPGGPRALARAPAGAWACLAVVGSRISEPGILAEVTSAVFFIPAWAFGLKGAHAWAHRLDDRIVSATPFAAGAALAGLGAVTGPATVFLYSAVAFLVTLMLARSAADLPPSRRSRAVLGAQVLVALSGGAIGVAAVASGFTSAAWAMGALVVAGGSIDLALTSRNERTRAAPATARVDLLADRLPKVRAEMLRFDLRKPVEVPRVDELREAASILLAASKRARAIRLEALEEFARARGAPYSIRLRAIEVIDELLDSIGSRTS